MNRHGDEKTSATERQMSPQSTNDYAKGVQSQGGYEGMSVGQYIATRIPSLKPPLTQLGNPIIGLRKLTTMQWMFFLV